MTIDEHPLRYSPIIAKIERIISRRIRQNRIDGYVLEMALEIAEAEYEQTTGSSGFTFPKMTDQ